MDSITNKERMPCTKSDVFSVRAADLGFKNIEAKLTILIPTGVQNGHVKFGDDLMRSRIRIPFKVRPGAQKNRIFK